MASLAQKKIIWCDRYIDDLNLYIERIQEEVPYLEFIKCYDSLDAARILEKNKDISLVISAQVFFEMSGVDFYQKIDRDYSSRLPFILFTSALKDSEIDSYCLRENFRFIPKSILDHHFFAEREALGSTINLLIYAIDELVFKNDENLSSIHLKLRELRTTLGLSLELFSEVVDFDLKSVTSYENSSEKIPSSYIHHLSKKFNIPSSLFTYGPVTAFTARVHKLLRKTDSDLIKKLIIS